MLNNEIQNAIDEFNSSPIALYYKKYGENVAAGRANSSLFAKHTLPNIIKRKTRNRITKAKLIEGHTLYWNHLGKLLNFLGKRGKPISWGLYLDLCNEYELTPTTGHDKTIKNSGPSEPILVYKLIEIPKETYSSKKELSRKLLGNATGNARIRLHEGIIDYTKKIHYTTDVTNRKCRFKTTGNTTQIGNRTPSNEIQVYELIEQLVPYSNTQTEFPSLEEVRRVLGTDVAIQKQLNGEIYQSKGYRFKRLN